MTDSIHLIQTYGEYEYEHSKLYTYSQNILSHLILTVACSHCEEEVSP